MSRSRGKEIIRITEITIAMIMGITGATSLLAWGSKGFTDWDVLGWFGYKSEPAPEETPDEDPQALAAGYKFVTALEASRSSTTAGTLGSRAVSSEATTELEDYIKTNKWTDITTDDYLAKVTVKNNIDGQTVSAKAAGIKIVNGSSTLVFSCVAPREIPFEHLRTGYVYKDTALTYKNVNKPCMYKTLFTHWDIYGLDMFTSTAEQMGQVEITYILEKDPNYEVSLPEEPTKEGYTFAGWYYGTDSEHGENCTAYNGEQITAETKLHAHFNINRYTVTFDSAGGKEIENQVVDWSTELTPPTPEKTGYDFKGWYLPDGTEYTGQAIKEDLTLIAHWQIKVFTVTFYVGGEVYATREVNYGTTFAELAEEAKGLNLKVLSIITGLGEQPLDDYANTIITENYAVNSTNLTTVERITYFFNNYPWVFVVVGAVLSVIIGIIGAVLYNKQVKPAVRRRGKKR